MARDAQPDDAAPRAALPQARSRRRPRAAAAPALKELKVEEYATFRSPAAWKFIVRHRCLPEQLLDGAFLVAHFADAKALSLGELGWGDDEARLLAAALEHATAHGALKALTTISLYNNRIGDWGARHLADALARGAAPALERIDVRTCYAGSMTAQQAVRDALKQRCA